MGKPCRRGLFEGLAREKVSLGTRRIAQFRAQRGYKNDGPQKGEKEGREKNRPNAARTGKSFNYQSLLFIVTVCVADGTEQREPLSYCNAQIKVSDVRSPPCISPFPLLSSDATFEENDSFQV